MLGDPVASPLDRRESKVTNRVAADHDSVELSLVHFAKVEIGLELHFLHAHLLALAVIPHKHSGNDALFGREAEELFVVFLKLCKIRCAPHPKGYDIELVEPFLDVWDLVEIVLVESDPHIELSALDIVVASFSYLASSSSVICDLKFSSR